jgi:predicted dehydrogenase
VPAYRRSGRADIVAVYDRRTERASELARILGARSYAGELNEMLEREHLDAVSVCTPPWLHSAQTVQALEAGVNVVVEKPMAMSEADCRRMCDAASRGSRKLCVSHNFLFSRAVTRARRRIEAGRAGRIESVLGFQMSTPRRRLPDWYESLPGQLFFDEAPHLVYLTRRFLGPGEPVLVSASALEGQPSEVQRTQNVVSVLQGEAGLGVLTMTFNASRAEWGFAVVGSKESYLIDLFRDQLVVLGMGGAHTPGEVLGQTAGGLAQMTTGAVASGTLYATRRLLYGHRELIDGFVAAVLDDREVPVSGEEGLRTIRLLTGICERAQLAAGTGA